MNQSNNTQNIQEDEIDLKELFLTIWNKKIFIMIFTSIITILAGIYAFNVTPTYEVKTVIRIGYIGDKLLEEPNIVEKKLRLIFSVDNRINTKDETSPAIVSSIKIDKNINNFLSIKTQAKSKEEAIAKNEEVIKFLQDEYSYKLEEFIYNTNLSINEYEKKIKYLNTITKPNLLKDIFKLKNQTIVNIDQKIDLIKTNNIMNINKRIKFLKEVELKSINNKINFSNKKLKEYKKSINNLKITSKTSSSDAMVMSMQILFNQNLLLNLEEKIENLEKEKKNILIFTINNLKEKRVNLIKIDIKNLIIKKENIINDKINDLNIKINVDLEKQINDLIILIDKNKLRLKPHYATNSIIVGNLIAKDNAIKPKKKLIVIVSFVTGLILSIFIVFFMNFIQGFKEESN